MSQNILIMVLLVVLIILYGSSMYETYVSGSYDISASITTDMDWKGATLSKYPYFTNNLVNAPSDVLEKIKQLQKYQSEQDGPTNSTYVSNNMNVDKNLDSPDNREGFTMMNPYISN